VKLGRYLEIREAVLAMAKEVEDKKRISYTAGDQNVLRNFASDSEFVGTNQLQNCLTHFMKQVRGISSFVVNPDVEPSESLASRAADVINYVCLMVANAEEMGRDTGLSGKKPIMYVEDGIMNVADWKKILSSPWWNAPVFSSQLPPCSFVSTDKDDKPTAKVLDDYYTYTFGKDDV